MYYKRNLDNTWSDATHFQAIGARRLFPCWDNPTIMATFNISIKHYRKYKVFSNMPIQIVEIHKHKQYKTETYLWTYFDITPAMSTHIVTLVITPITALYNFRTYHSAVHITLYTSNIIIWFRPELSNHIKYAHKVAHEIMLQLKDKWGSLQIPTVQFTAICGLLYDNQNWGLVLNREINILYDEKLHSVGHKINVAQLIGREMIYQWFGNLINPLWSSHLWLIDGLTILFAMDAINSIENYRNPEMLDLFIVQAQFESLRLDTLSFMNALNSTTPDDFWAVMQTTVDESHDDPYIKKHMPSLKMMIYNWTSMDYPMLKITRDYYKNRYYRVNYDPENWQKIAKYLNSKEFTKIHVLNRAKIIDDAFYFMVEQQLDPSIFWELISYLARETNYIAWYPMIKALEYMSSVFPLPNEEVQNIKYKITTMLRFLFWKINYEEDSKENDLTKCLRQEGIKWACILGESECQRVAHDRLLEHIQKLKTNKYYRLLPWWEEWIYC
ncbi:aminopeptidase N-like, partial [Formica exsecta]|uniref:aminopeptidase N-like n=1 Tax=Formica exsecta TaxID=72781 RepID=UPI0011412006